MADELKHKSVGPSMTQSEYEGVSHEAGPDGYIVETVSGEAKWVSHTHAENAADELRVENLGTGQLSGDVPFLSDGGGGVKSAQLQHFKLSDVGPNDHHPQVHNVASHSDTTATGTELNTLVDGNENALHSHEMPIQFIPGGQSADTNEMQYLIPMYKDNTGVIDRAVLVNTEDILGDDIGVIELRRVKNNWVHDGSMARDPSSQLNWTGSSYARTTGFAIDGPGSATTKRVLFMHSFDDADSDKLKIDSIDLTDKASSVSVVAVTLAGANQPPATFHGTIISIVLSKTKIMCLLEDDIYFGDITGTETGFTITFTDSPVLAGYAINPWGAAFSGIRINNQIMVIVSSAEGPYKVWELTTAGAKVDEFNYVLFGWMSSGLGAVVTHPAAVWAIQGEFAIAVASAAAGPGYTTNYIATIAPLNDLVDN